MARLGDNLQAIRQVCRADDPTPTIHAVPVVKPVVSIDRRIPKPELAQLRAGVTDLVLRALKARISGNDILINVGIAIDAAARIAEMPIERAQ
jgi:hypothetical protein